MLKKIFVIAFPLCLLIVGATFSFLFLKNSKDDVSLESKPKPNDPLSVDIRPISSIAPIEKPVINLDDWNLMLVGPNNKLVDDYSFEKKKTSNEKEVDSRIYENWIDMFTDAKNDGVDIFITSAYRSVELQSKLFQNNIDSHIANGSSKEQAIVLTKKYLTVPEYSEHHTGLALDIVTPSYQNLNDGFADTDAGKWLKDNAHKYGFILRYPKNKEDITNISFEPWHFRYVGNNHAEYIYSNDLCLEEYLQPA